MEFDSLYSILKVVLGVGLVIFVHELGHFLAARRCGVRVEVFSLGMGPRLFSWVRGATRYQVSAVPIGGYVRMAGEDRRLDGLPPEPDDLAAKSVGARFFIYSGGVLMNVLFGLVVFPILFAVGVPLQRPVLGEPTPGGAAWEAGLTAGTEVLSVNGKGVFEFVHIPVAVALGDPAGSDLLVRNADGTTRHVRVRPHYDEAAGAWMLGVDPPWLRGPRGGFVLEVEPDSPLARAGVHSGEELFGVVGGEPGLPLDHQLAAAAQGGPIEVRIGSADGAGPESERTVVIEPIEGKLAPARLGVQPPFNRIAGLRGRANALRADGASSGVRVGDLLLTVGGRPLLRYGDLGRALLEPFAGDAGRPVTLPFTFESDGEPGKGELRLASRADALALAADLALANDLDTTALVVNQGEPAALAGIRDGDRVRTIDGVESAGWDDTRKLIQALAADGAPMAIEVERLEQGTRRALTVTVAAAAQPTYDYRIVRRLDEYLFRTDGVVASIRAGFDASWRFAEDVVVTLRRWMTRDVSAKNFGGPISIAIISNSFAQSGWTKLFFFLCMLSINLAIVNVLPIPLLDGGHLFFLLVEKVKGSPVSERVLVYSQVVGMVLIISAMIFITYNDIVRWFFPAA
jgi:regulator of sigma E protease